MPEQVKTPDPSNPFAPMTVKPVKFIHRNEDRMPIYHADGGWGISSHNHLIRINFYTENPPCPTSVIQDVNPDGSAKGQQMEIGVDDPDYFLIVRDFQCSIVLTPQSAIQIHQMLGSFIKVVQEQLLENFKQAQAKQQEAAQK
jgi:hypothetical protein